MGVGRFGRSHGRHREERFSKKTAGGFVVPDVDDRRQDYLSIIDVIGYLEGSLVGVTSDKPYDWATSDPYLKEHL